MTAKNPKSKTPAPFIAATPASVFGEVPTEVVDDPNTSMLDLPGYSDKRREFELAVRKGTPATPVSHRFHCVRWKGDQSRTAEFRANGYRTVKWDECVDADGKSIENTFGIDLTRMPAAERAPDGTTLCGDLQLMVIDAAGAAIISRRHDNEVNADLRAAEAKFQDAAERRGTTAVVAEQDRDEPVYGQPN